MTRLIIFIGAVLCATPAFAQTYVAAALGADVTKSYESTTNGTTFPDGDRDSIGWGLRVGTTLGRRWGVELEFNRSGELELQNGPIFLGQSLPNGSIAFPQLPTLPGLVDGRSAIFPAPEFHIDQRNTTWNTSAWFSQPLGTHADLVILGGLGFSRVVQNTEYSISGPRRLLDLIPIAQRSYRTRTINYGVGPLVGAEGRIHMTDHLALTPGFRAQSLGNDLARVLLLRPSVALHWSF